MPRALSTLTPLAWLYGFGVWLRRQAYARGMFPQARLRSPVISVGGLAMGGSMKTPLVVELARAISARGPAVGVLGHGYRGRDGSPRVVSDGAKPLETAETVGDEALLLAYELPGCPVVVGRDKVAAGRLLEKRFGKRILIVDSGFQHLRLFRDLDIVSVSEGDLGERVLPAGMLRESARALKAAHLIFTDRETDGARVARLRAQRPSDVFSLARADFGFFPLEGTGLEQEPPERAFAFCGIGKPERFVMDIKARGVTVAGQRFFRDHHRFTEQDLRDVATAATTAGATAVVTTAKDAVRIDAWSGSVPLLVLSARLDIENLPAVLKRIDRMILARIKAKS
ncbi:MAG: tetraacyldisaccharide 4'-kinase [Vicinamibacteria bacterium]|nr:tetraacyldisaccharide 4'-kinase [Vicinamibacteria bacterium]